MRTTVLCGDCGGDGGFETLPDSYWGSHWTECPTCGGEGEIEADMQPLTEAEIMEPAWR